MKINRIKNVTKFFEFVDECEGGVFIKSTDGSIINLKSELTKYYAVANIFSAGEEIKNEFEVTFDNPVDLNRCIAFCVGA